MAGRADGAATTSGDNAPGLSDCQLVHRYGLLQSSHDIADQGPVRRGRALLPRDPRHWPEHAIVTEQPGHRHLAAGTHGRKPRNTIAGLSSSTLAIIAILNNLGNVMWEQGQLEEAIEFYRRAVEFRPDSPEVLMNFGVNLCDLGELEESVRVPPGVPRAGAGAADCHLNLGNTLARQGDLDGALACYEHAAPSSDPIIPRHAAIVPISGSTVATSSTDGRSTNGG